MRRWRAPKGFYANGDRALDATPFVRIFVVDTHSEEMTVRTRVKKWGNSLALRIPRAFAVEAGLEPDADVQMTLENGSLVVKPVVRRRFRLADLLAQVTDDNVHEEVEAGSAIGNEAW